MKAIVDGIATEYIKTGTGRTIIMLHGWQDNMHSFDGISEKLSKKYTVVTLDLPGFGKTEPPPNAWNISCYVDFVAKFVKKINIKPYAILGHSFGGRIVIKGISENVLTGERIVLMGSAGISKGITIRNKTITLVTKIFSVITLIPPFILFRNKLRAKLYRSIGSDYLNAGELKNTYLSIIADDLKENLKKIKQPTQLIWGSNDTETPLSDAKTMNKLINNSKLNILEDAGHMVHKEKPLEVSQIIEKFLA